MAGAEKNTGMNLLLQKISLPLASFVLEVDVEIRNRCVGVFGPSGAGKTSLLDLVAGLRRPPSAFIQFDGQVLTDTVSGVRVPARRRGIGYVPQDLALFPHLSVKQNLLYGRKADAGTTGLFSLEHVTEVLEIQPLIARGVLDLSGGEKQRVALARALLTSPRLLLLDEPLAGLDTGLKARILPYLARVRDEFKLPMLYVSHNADEISALCDEVMVMNRGKIVSRNPVSGPGWPPEPEL
jgi:molybdate transport system ATP-binding protein